MSVEKHNPYRAQVTKVNPDTGWCSVFFLLQRNPLTQHRLGVIVGDIMHNLRCALDYIVTALVDSSGAALSMKHQFPIYLSRTLYEKDVGNASLSNPQGPLTGISIGVDRIWDLQPFHRQRNPRFDPLFIVYRFSNADKHRVTAWHVPVLMGGVGEIVHDGCIIEQVELSPPPVWEVAAYEIGRVRFSKPYPTDVTFHTNASVEVHIGTPAFGMDSNELVIPIGVLDSICNHVAMITDTFKAL